MKGRVYSITSYNLMNLLFKYTIFKIYRITFKEISGQHIDTNSPYNSSFFKEVQVSSDHKV